MTEKIRILFLSANPGTTSRILVDEEAREIFEKLQEGTYRDKFELYKHPAMRPIDLQRLLMMYEPHIVHFSGHGSKTHKIILGGTPGRGKEVDRQGLVEVFAQHKNHVRLVLLNACFTKAQARSLTEVIDYSVGTGTGIGDKASVAFAGAFYRALGFGKSVKDAFDSAKAELGLTKMPRTKGIELFVRNGISGNDLFPKTDNNFGSNGGPPWGLSSEQLLAGHSSDYETRGRYSPWLHENSVFERMEERSERQTTVLEISTVSRSSRRIRSQIECGTCQASQVHVSPILTGTASPARGPMAPGREGSRADSKSLRQSKRANRTKADATEAEAGPRTVEHYSLAYVGVIVEFRRVPIPDAADISQTQPVDENQVCRIGTNFGTGELIVTHTKNHAL
jgi:hypothetical protein